MSLLGVEQIGLLHRDPPFLPVAFERVPVPPGVMLEAARLEVAASFSTSKGSLVCFEIRSTTSSTIDDRAALNAKIGGRSAHGRAMEPDFRSD